LPVQAATVAELQTSGRVQLRSWLVPARDIVPGQQVKLNLEIATDRWFTGGTRVQIPEVPGLVILQTDNFASNSSEQRQGKSWVVQRWTLEVYPQRAGSFTIPPVTARITVNDEGGIAVTGEVTGPALQFTVFLPESLARVEHWVAAPDFTVSQTFDRDLESLAVGDAIAREVVFEADEIMAMMLPAFKEEKIPGLTAYPEPPVLNNSSNRGATVASRRARITYIVEAQGKYQLPAQDYFWWDTRTGELQLLSLPTINILVGTGEAANNTKESPVALRLKPLMAVVTGIILLAALIWLGMKLPIRALWQRFNANYRRLMQLVRHVRKPVLPARLNPGNSAGE
jgi:hypothetical protein